jgi:hypothetical protein
MVFHSSQDNKFKQETVQSFYNLNEYLKEKTMTFEYGRYFGFQVSTFFTLESLNTQFLFNTFLEHKDCRLTFWSLGAEQIW